MDTSLGWLGKVPSPLAGCWYLDWHWEPGTEHRTDLGRLVYRAKTYGDKKGDVAAARQLGNLMARQSKIALHNPRFPLEEVDVVFAVPAFPEKEPFNLPDILADYVAKTLRTDPDKPVRLVKTMETPQAKYASREEILRAAEKAYEVQGTLGGRVVLLVDDLVQSGATLAAIADHLIAAGASSVGGFAATRARAGMVK